MLFIHDKRYKFCTFLRIVREWGILKTDFILLYFKDLFIVKYYFLEFKLHY